MVADIQKKNLALDKILNYRQRILLRTTGRLNVIADLHKNESCFGEYDDCLWLQIYRKRMFLATTSSLLVVADIQKKNLALGKMLINCDCRYTDKKSWVEKLVD